MYKNLLNIISSFLLIYIIYYIECYIVIKIQYNVSPFHK